jgi:AraC family transcriptional regulator
VSVIERIVSKTCPDDRQVVMSIKIVEKPAFQVVGLQIETTPMSAKIPALWPQFVAREREIEGVNEPNVSYGVMSHPEPTMATLLYTACLPVSDAGLIPPGMVRIHIPGGTYAAFRFPLSGLAKGFGEIFNRLLPSSEFVRVPGPYFERYDEAFDPGNALSMVGIYLPVRRRSAA